MPPYGDRETQLAFLRDYYREYRVENAQAIYARRADWFQENKATLRVKQRIRRALNRCEPGLKVLQGEEREAARMAIVAEAMDRKAADETLVYLWRPVSPLGRQRFLDAIKSPREKSKWMAILGRE